MSTQHYLVNILLPPFKCSDVYLLLKFYTLLYASHAVNKINSRNYYIQVSFFIYFCYASLYMYIYPYLFVLYTFIENRYISYNMFLLQFPFLLFPSISSPSPLLIQIHLLLSLKNEMFLRTDNKIILN